MTQGDTARPLKIRAVEWFAARSMLVGGAAAAAAPIVNALVPQTAGLARAGLTAGLVLLALTGFAVPAAKARLAETRAEKAEEDAAATSVRMRVGLSDVLLPLLSYAISGLDHASSESRDQVRGGVLRTVLAAAANLCGGDARVRACWYEYDSGDQTDGKAKFAPKGHYGRGQRPSTRFMLAEDRGAVLADMVITDHHELWPNLDQNRPKSWKPTGNDTTYAGFLAVAVRTEHRAFGILTVDTDEPDVLDESDVLIAQVLSWILALGLSQCEGDAATQAAPGVAP